MFGVGLLMTSQHSEPTQKVANISTIEGTLVTCPTGTELFCHLLQAANFQHDLILTLVEDI